MRRSFALRLAAAFAGVGIAAASLTAILVNLAFGGRFTDYLDAQQQTKENQLVAILADSYARSGGWDTTDLRSLTPLTLWTEAPCASSMPPGGPCGRRVRTSYWDRWPRCTGR
jgi:two-component system sensor histidine kinase BaeS